MPNDKKIIHCQVCGGPIEVFVNETKIICPYCKSEQIISNERNQKKAVNKKSIIGIAAAVIVVLIVLFIKFVDITWEDDTMPVSNNNVQTESAQNNNSNQNAQSGNQYVKAYSGLLKQYASDSTYCIYDMDSDGISELIINAQSTEKANTRNIYIYSIQNGQAVRLTASSQWLSSDGGFKESSLKGAVTIHKPYDGDGIAVQYHSANTPNGISRIVKRGNSVKDLNNDKSAKTGTELPIYPVTDTSGLENA